MQWSDRAARKLIADHYAWFLPTYDAYPYDIQRVDAVRYFILHQHGGVYMDMDIGCRRPLDALVASLPAGAGLFMQTSPMGLSNDLMIAPPQSPILWHLAQSLHGASGWYGTHYLSVAFSTGSGFLTLGYDRVRGRTAKVLRREHYENRNGSFFYHVPGSTWHKSDADFLLMLSPLMHWCRLCVVVVVVVVVSLVIIGVYLSFATLSALCNVCQAQTSHPRDVLEGKAHV